MNRKEMIADLVTLKEFFEEQNGAYPLSLEFAINELKERKTGKWVEGYKCSECGYSALLRVEHDGEVVWENVMMKYCPNCGVRMVMDDV